MVESTLLASYDHFTFYTIVTTYLENYTFSNLCAHQTYNLKNTYVCIQMSICNTFTPQIKGPEYDTLLHVALLWYNFPMECDTTSLSVLQLCIRM